MNVVSLFDGISCGQIALERAGIEVKEYYASEIHEYSMKVTNKNFPNTIQLGDVVELKGDKLLSLPKIDLLIGGSPCQGLSKANANRKNLEDPRSKLFYEYIRILNELKPTYFLLENVEMDKESMDIFNELTGVEGILINSNLVSAQNRKRYYWTNIPNVNQPEDKGLVIKDILIEGDYETVDFSIYNPIECKNYYQFDVSGKGYKSQQDRAFKLTNKYGCFPSARATTKRKIAISEYVYRNLSLNECESLQTLPHNYTLLDDKNYSIDQSLIALGNGWTVDVVSHILKNIK